MIVPELVEAIADIDAAGACCAGKTGAHGSMEMAALPAAGSITRGAGAAGGELAGDRENAPSMLKHGLGSVVSTTIGVAGSVISYHHLHRLCTQFLPADAEREDRRAGSGAHRLPVPRAAERTVQVCCLLDKNFSSFIAGQCLEAVILGSMFVVSMTLLRMPYAVMVGVLIAFTALIPIVGAFIGCFVGAFLILLENPPYGRRWLSGAVPGAAAGRHLYLPPCGGQLGGSAPSIWVLAAVTVGGSLFGIVGMLVFIPLISTAYSPAAGQRQCPQCGPCRPERPVSASGRVE